MMKNHSQTSPRQRLGRVSQTGSNTIYDVDHEDGAIPKNNNRRSRIIVCWKLLNNAHFIISCSIVTSFLALTVWWIQQHAAVIQTHKVGGLSGVIKLEKSNVKRSNQNKNEIQPPLPKVKTLTAYLEKVDPIWMNRKPLPPRTTSSSELTSVTFPKVSCFQDQVENFPIDDYPTDDPFLPWIHDYFPTKNGSYIQFVAQNKRRCNTGLEHEATMKFWEPQISLFQPIPIDNVIDDAANTTSARNGQSRKYRLGTSLETATFPETRFMCYFHNSRGQEATTFSAFNFNYEYVSWRKGKPSMIATTGKDADQFWLSQLLFRCPVPTIFQEDIQQGRHVIFDDGNRQHKWISHLWLDLVPIRTPTRHGEVMFTQRHVGQKHLKDARIFNANKAWGNKHVLPAISDSGRWANLPICHLPRPSSLWNNQQTVPGQHDGVPVKSISSTTTTTHIATTAKPFRLVACTWTAASYTRRGDAVSVNDSAQRLREWIVFHLMVGFDHLYIYDNTQSQQSPLRPVAMEFEDRVTYHSWPCTICNNNRPNHPNPGERSSQYGAEASCRERYGPMTDWMAFIDTDEYLVPMAPQDSLANSTPTWNSVLDEMDAKQIRILQMKSSRAKPRHELMEILDDQSTCKDIKKNYRTVPTEPCVGPRRNETLLRVYNCEFIRPPRPVRFARAMKQIYRTDYVLSHFVHYSTVTEDVAKYFADYSSAESGGNINYVRNVHRKDWIAPEIFLDELTQGTLIHTRSVLPHETMRRSYECYLNSKYNCILGYKCPDSVEFVDGRYQENGFHDTAGKYCNCWSNERIESVFVPRLEALLKQNAPLQSKS